jgi:bifunctional non-homologous end joining protein LigD
MVIDLDPGDRNSFEEVIEAALATKQILDKCKATAYCKTSGSTGLHIYVPMRARYDYEQVKNFAHILVSMVEEMLPDTTTLERNLKKRGDKKIYLDYLQNRTGQTLASVYSVRPKPGATVSIPLEWKEVKSGLTPQDFTIQNALHRVKRKGDIFKPVLGAGVDMHKCLRLLGE